MASPNNPKSSAQLIREHSAARYLKVNKLDVYGNTCGTESAENNKALAREAVALMVRKYGR